MPDQCVLGTLGRSVSTDPLSNQGGGLLAVGVARLPQVLVGGLQATQREGIPKEVKGWSLLEEAKKVQDDSVQVLWPIHLH